MTPSSETVEAPARAMTRWAPRCAAGRSVKKARTSAVNAKSGIGVAHANMILVARLLRDDQAFSRGFGQELDGGGDDVRHDARALRAAGDEQTQLAIGEIGIGNLGRLDAPSAARDCRS